MATSPPSPRRSTSPSGADERRGRRRTKGAAARPRRGILWRWRRAGYAFLVLGIVAIGGVWAALNTIQLPPAKRPIETSFVCDITVADGQCGVDSSMARLSAKEERILVDYNELPPVLVQAVLSTEDRNFFDHNGVDPVGIGRALVQDLKGGGGSEQGGSTITQQYVKSVYLSPERTLTRKLKEAVLAVKLERTLDKRQILTRYLNEVYFGRGAYGVEAASRVYFGIGVKDLRLAQASYLAGLIRAPERADATKNPSEATRRRSVTLAAMVEEGYITRAEAVQAGAVPWISSPTGPDGTPQQVTILARASDRSDFAEVAYKEIGSQYWVEWVRQQLRARLGPGAETRGLRVYTTFDPTLQKYATDAVAGTLDQPDGPVGSLVAVDKDGRIRAMVAGSDYGSDKVNLALGTAGGGSGRSPGSTFKPFALAAFVEDGYSVKSRFRAPPTTQFPNVYASQGVLWKPANYDRADRGVLSVEEATWNSVNTVYAGIVDTVTPQRVADMANRLGVRSKLDPVYALVLGTEEVSVLDMASAYSTFADRGSHIEPYVIRRIEDSEGTVLFDAATDVGRQQVVSQGVADTVTNVLRGVVSTGTGKAAAISADAAGKTGTTNDSKDAWFTGYTCNLTASVWMGYEQPRQMKSYKGRTVAGGTFPAAIWKAFMSRATQGDAPCTYPATDAGKKLLNSGLALSSATTTRPAPSGSSTSSTSIPKSTTTSVPGAAAAAPTTSERKAPIPTVAAPPVTVVGAVPNAPSG